MFKAGVEQVSDRIPVHIICGFLGVGKTTAILHLLSQLAGREFAAVLVNERGEVGLDGAILASESPGVKVREVAGGCICCTAGAALTSALGEIIERVRPDRIFIEPSGVAKPGEVRDILAGPDFAQALELMPLIGLVDPARFISGRAMEQPIYRDQVEASEVLMANRCDLCDHQALREFYAKARELFPPKAAILAASHGRLPLEILEVHRDPGRVQAYLPGLGDIRRPGVRPPAAEHDGLPAGFGQMGWTWPAGVVFDHGRLDRVFRDLQAGAAGLAGKVERAKGVFHTERGWFLLELALEDFFARETQYRSDSRCQFIVHGSDGRDGGLIRELIEPCIAAGVGQPPGPNRGNRPAAETGPGSMQGGEI